MIDCLEFEHRGHRYRAEAASVNISAGGTARPSNAKWFVKVDDLPEDIAFEASSSDTEADVTNRIIAWDEQRRRKSGDGGE